MPVFNNSAKPDSSTIACSENDIELLNEIYDLLKDISTTQEHIEKTKSNINKIEDSKKHGMSVMDQGLNRLLISQKKVDALTESVNKAKKKQEESEEYWKEFGFEAKLLPSSFDQTIGGDENHIAHEHYEFIFSKLDKKQTKPYHIGIRHKNGKLNFLFARPESCLPKPLMDQLSKQLNEAECNQPQVNWRQTMLTIRKALIKSS